MVPPISAITEDAGEYPALTAAADVTRVGGSADPFQDREYTVTYFWKVVASDDYGHETECDEPFTIHLSLNETFIRGDIDADMEIAKTMLCTS